MTFAGLKQGVTDKATTFPGPKQALEINVKAVAGSTKTVVDKTKTVAVDNLPTAGFGGTTSSNRHVAKFSGQKFPLESFGDRRSMRGLRSCHVITSSRR